MDICCKTRLCILGEAPFSSTSNVHFIKTNAERKFLLEQTLNKGKPLMYPNRNMMTDGFPNRRSE